MRTRTVLSSLAGWLLGSRRLLCVKYHNNILELLEQFRYYAWLSSPFDENIVLVGASRKVRTVAGGLPHQHKLGTRMAEKGVTIERSEYF